ncbi:hypothetical protein CAL7716_085340 [Calothrix sp. PCC 7716]|nr:hypothetical protein CAL7716_085340 [Calothrix sp. PCC 7716]
MKAGDVITGSFLTSEGDTEYCLVVEAISKDNKVTITRFHGNQTLLDVAIHEIVGREVTVCALHPETRDLHLCFRHSDGSLTTWKMDKPEGGIEIL